MIDLVLAVWTKDGSQVSGGPETLHKSLGPHSADDRPYSVANEVATLT